MLRAILVVKSSYYHRILHPSDAPCSNDYLLSMAYRHAPYQFPPSITISNSHIRLLDHILRHSAETEHSLCCNNSLSLRTISSPHRGAPRAHWSKTAVAESQFRFLCLTHGNRPEAGNFLHRFYTHCTIYTNSVHGLALTCPIGMIPPNKCTSYCLQHRNGNTGDNCYPEMKIRSRCCLLLMCCLDWRHCALKKNHFVPSVDEIFIHFQIPSSPTSLSVGPLPICPALKRKSALRPRPLPLQASTAAPAARSCSATEPWPNRAARCSGVMPRGGQGNGSGRSPGPWRKFASEVF